MEDIRDKFKVAFRAINEEAKPKAKPAKEKKEERPLSNNPGYGYHGVLAKKHGDNTKAHAEFKKMHAKVKDLAGEAGHLTNSKKPNEMVRDYLDSKMGRHLEGYEEDPHYIKKSFGTFSRTYKPELFQEEVLNEGDVSFHEKPDDWYKDGRTMVHVHHKGKHVATIQKMSDRSEYGPERHIIVSPDTKHVHHDDRFNDPMPNEYKKKTLFGKVKPGQEHDKISKGFDSRRSALRYAKNVYSGKLNESARPSAEAVFKTILESKATKVHPDSLVGHDLDDESFATKK